MSNLKDQAGRLLRYLANRHVQGDQPNIFLFSSPRSGSTWMLETLIAEPGTKPCNEPFNLRKPNIAQKLGTTDWNDLHDPEKLGVLETYINRFIEGRESFKNLRPGQEGYRYLTDRIVFKILFALEDNLEWLRKHFHAQTIHLIRHPIPVALSREYFPRLDALLRANINLSQEQKSRAEQIIGSGSKVEKGILDWSLQNRLLLQSDEHIDLFVTYEQFVLEPLKIVERLSSAFSLTNTEAMSIAAGRLSGSTSKSNAESLKILADRKNNQLGLLEKWRKTIDAASETALMDIPHQFDVPVYSAGDVLPGKDFQIESGLQA